MEKRGKHRDLDLIARHLSGETSQEENQHLDAWLEEAEENRSLFNEYLSLWKKIGKVSSIAGLDMDYKGIPFGPMPRLMSIAEYVTKVHAICVRCGDLANSTHRLSEDDKLIVLGETDIYEPLCRICYAKDKKPR